MLADTFVFAKAEAGVGPHINRLLFAGSCSHVDGPSVSDALLRRAIPLMRRVPEVPNFERSDPPEGLADSDLGVFSLHP